jgi:hypothetical protein
VSRLKLRILGLTLSPHGDKLYLVRGGIAMVESATANKPKKMRSPAYPGINLEIALKRARGLYDKERRNAVAYPVAVSYWGFGAKSSGGLVSVAAMKGFGLVEDVERGAGGRSIKLTDLAFHILLDDRPNSQERAELIKQAALRPKIHASLWRKYGAELPSDSNLKHALIFDFKFNENTVDEFIKEYKETIRFAGIGASDTLSLLDEDKNNGTDNGASDGGQAVQEQQVGSSRMSLAPPPAKINPAAKPVGASIPVTKNCSISVLAVGEVTQKGLDQLINYLNLIKGSFPEDEGAKAQN